SFRGRVPQEFPQRDRLDPAFGQVEVDAVLPCRLPPLHLERDDFHRAAAAIGETRLNVRGTPGERIVGGTDGPSCRRPTSTLFKVNRLREPRPKSARGRRKKAGFGPLPLQKNSA